jgi:hypothetical protein
VLFAEEKSRASELARMCLETKMQPPLAGPTIEALEKLSGRLDQSEKDR